MATQFAKDAPWETHLMSVLEDFGLVKILDGPSDFKTGMFDHGFLFPDWVLNAVVVLTVLHWLFSASG